MLIPKKVKHRKWSRFALRKAQLANRGSAIPIKSESGQI